VKKIFFETIKIENGEARGLNFHAARIERTQRENFDRYEKIDLENALSCNLKGVVRCKLIYSNAMLAVAFFPYTPKRIEKVKVLFDDTIEYGYKYLDRSPFEKLLAENREYDEVLIVKDGLITDITIANVAFLYKNEWLTPKEPLLKGTFRESMLERSVIKEEYIEAKELKKFESFAIMNAMVGFKEIKNCIIE